LCRYEFGVGRNHREIDYGEEAESEGEDEESEKQQEGCPGAQKEEVLGKEEQRQEGRRKEERQEVERQKGRSEGRSEEIQGQKGRGAQESCAQASSSGPRTSGSNTGAIMVAVRVELRQQRRRFLIPGVVEGPCFQCVIAAPSGAANGVLRCMPIASCEAPIAYRSRPQ
jgi:hypothetical protein